MKKDGIIISVCVIFFTLVEVVAFYATLNITQMFIENLIVKGLLMSFVFVAVSIIIYGLVLPKIFAKFSMKSNSVFKAFLIFNIAFNIFSGVIGIYTYLYFVLINPNVMFLNLIVDDFGHRTDLLWNISYYALLIVITFAKPLLLKHSMNFKNKS